MSTQYDKVIFSNERTILKVNFSGIHKGETTQNDLKMSFYAYDGSTGAIKFSETLNFDQIQNLYEHLGQISIIRNSELTRSGKFVETTEGIADLIEKLKIIDGSMRIGNSISGVF